MVFPFLFENKFNENPQKILRMVKEEKIPQVEEKVIIYTPT